MLGLSQKLLAAPRKRTNGNFRARNDLRCITSRRSGKLVEGYRNRPPVNENISRRTYTHQHNNVETRLRYLARGSNARATNRDLETNEQCSTGPRMFAKKDSPNIDHSVR